MKEEIPKLPNITNLPPHVKKKKNSKLLEQLVVEMLYSTKFGSNL